MRSKTRIVLTMVLVGLMTTGGVAFASHQFTDVSETNTFHEDIAWLAENGITKGCNPPDNTMFCPDEAVTRGELAAFLHRFADNIGGTSGPPGPQGEQGEPGEQGEQGPAGVALVADRITAENPAYGDVRVVDVPGDSGGPDDFTTLLFEPVTLDAGTYKIEATVQFFDFPGGADGLEYGLARSFLNGAPIGTLWSSDIPEDGDNAAHTSGSQLLEVTEDDSTFEVMVMVRGDDKAVAAQAGGNLIVTQFNE